jgi:hypothetical protein
MARNTAPDHRSIEHAERGERQRSGLIGNPGWVRSSAWICPGFSRGQHHCMGRWIDIEPDDVDEFGDKTVLREHLKVSRRCGCMWCAHQMHRTELSEIASAIAQLVQRVASCGGWSQVNGITRAVIAQQTNNAGLGKALLPAPIRRPAMPMLWAARCAECRSAETSMMRARLICLRRRLPSATIAASRWRSTALRTTSIENHTDALSHGPHSPSPDRVSHLLMLW